ncbi:unnamed protein product [Pedinophyceae sp. YPF-701]|nr:unnamed protein product [Pedinophyceae sp. YPF-701]
MAGSQPQLEAANMSYTPQNVRDVPADAFIKAYAAHLKGTGKVQVPANSHIIKTGVRKEHGPYNPDWFYVRMAAAARRVYLHQNVGVGTFKRLFGGNYRRRTTAPEHFSTAAGGNIRKALQELERIGVVEKASAGGRAITRKGMSELDTVARSIELK